MRHRFENLLFKEGVMKMNHKVRVRVSAWWLFREPLTITILLTLALSVFTWTATADVWTGAGQAVASQTRDWRLATNWSPPVSNLNTFTYLGEGKIELNGLQSAGGMTFNDFSYATIAPGAILPTNLTMVNALGGGASFIRMGEGVRDTYGSDYFTAGSQITADVNINILNPVNAALSVNLGSLLPNGSNSAMMFSGQINNLNNNGLWYNGTGAGTSLWISSNNAFNGGMNNPITVASGGVGPDGYTLHLVDSGRMNFTPIDLQGTSSYLGLQDNTGGGPGGVLFPGNQYFNWVWSHGGNIFTDRSYQLPGQDSNTTVNVLQYLMGGVRDYNGMINFGSTGRFGRTNNGFSLRLGMFDWENNAVPTELVHVNNGNLTVGRGGSRYMSGANRLQEAHNYVFVDMLNEKSENQVNLIPLGKGGNGVLVVDRVNGGVQGGLQQWLSAPQVLAGVLSLGSINNNPHNAPFVQLLTPDAGVGIGWNAPVNLIAAAPFTIIPGGFIPGQAGAVDIDLWGYSAFIINTNTPGGPMPPTYLRLGSSKGGDATFDPQPNPLKHASIMPNTLVVPYIIPGWQRNIYYLGGGGGTLEIDAQLTDFQGNLTKLEMGTTGTLLPGRVALNPSQGVNTYTGPTDICAGTLQLMAQGSVWNSMMVNVWTYDLNITNGLYAVPRPYTNPWEGVGNYTWTGPGQLLLDPGKMGANNWDLNWYTAAGGMPLINVLTLDGGVIGWTGNVNLTGVPGNYGGTVNSNLANPLGQNVNVLGLGGEYSAGTMTSQFVIGNSPQGIPVLLYKAGMNSILDLTLGPAVNTFTGGTIIAGGEITINDTRQLNAHPAGNGGPIAILNGGRLHVTAGGAQGPIKPFGKAIKVNTSGTPDLLKNCGSVIDVDQNITAKLNANFDFSWAPATYLEKDGFGTLDYSAPAPPAAAPGQNPANAWGLKLTSGLVKIDQLPVNPGTDSGPVIFNNGNLETTATPAGINNVDKDPAYGFRNIVSFQGTASTVTVDDNTMFRTHGIVPSEILGTVNFVGSGDATSANNVVHLSRNMASIAAPIAPGDYTRGNGAMTFAGATVYMSGGGQGNALNILPQEAGFKLQLNDGVVFNASKQNNVCGEVNFNNLTPANPLKWVQINGAEALPATPFAGPPYAFATIADTWTIYGTGYTTWSGTTEKIGAGTVAIKRSKGAPVSVNANTLLKISGGTFEAGGTADPFTDTLTNLSLNIQNDSTGNGLLISEGSKRVNKITGTGKTTVNGPAGTVLTVASIEQGTLNIGSGFPAPEGLGCGPMPSDTVPNPVPEPSTWILLVLAAGGLLSWRTRGRLLKNGH
jgi:hypothetical protein